MKEKIKNTFTIISKKTKTIIYNIYLKISTKIKESFKKCRVGEENLKILLTYWCVIPSIIYLFLLKTTDCKFLTDLYDVIMLVLNSLNLYFIAKAVKIHPEYNTELMKELEKQEYYKTLNKNELREEKSKERKENTKNFFRRLLLIKTDRKVDFYKIVRCFVILILLITIKRIFL